MAAKLSQPNQLIFQQVLYAVFLDLAIPPKTMSWIIS